MNANAAGLFVGVDWGLTLAYLGAAIAVVLSGYGSARGVATAGQGAAGVVTEDPSKYGKTIILTALPGSQGIYGFVIGMLIFLKLQGKASIPISAGWSLLAAGIPIGIVGLLSALWQGRVAAAGIGIVAKRPEEASKGLVYAGMVETYAILSLVISFFLLNNVTL